MINSVFAEHAWKFIERGISLVPIAPGGKKPGQWSASRGWSGMGDWTRFATRIPTELELEHWNTWPDAGIGVILGPLSNLVGLDKDYDIPNGGNDALDAIIPYSPIAKKGQKGWTKFYRFNGERSCSFDVGGIRVLDVLADGRQTVVPPTMHPSGCSYVWITEETLDSILSVNELPQLPPDFFEQVERVLKPYQTDDDKKHQRRKITPKQDNGAIVTDKSVASKYYHDLNGAALANLDLWVPKLVPDAKPDQDGYRTVAVWRNVKNPNVGIHPTGIRDWGGNYGLTAVDLVMYANGWQFGRAAEELRKLVPIPGEEQFEFTGFGATPVKVAPPSPVFVPSATAIDQDEPTVAVPVGLTHAPGMLGRMAGWINETSQKFQPEFAVAAAVMVGAVVMSRRFKSDRNNFTSLYMMLIAMSTEGKDHPMHCVETLLHAAGLDGLLAGSGYTSDGAVYSELKRAPRHLAIIDEMGKYLKATRAGGNSSLEEAIDTLVRAYGKLHGMIRPKNYSTMTLTATQAQAMGSKVNILNPAISLFGASTPDTFYQNLTQDMVTDGFLGRMLVVESSQPPQLSREVVPTPVPPEVIEWIRAVEAEPKNGRGDLAGVESYELEPVTVPMRFGPGCSERLRTLEVEIHAISEKLHAESLYVLLGRTREKSMRLAMIVAKAVHPENNTIQLDDLEWSIQYVMHHDLALVESAKVKLRGESKVYKNVEKALRIIQHARDYGADNSKIGQACAQGLMPRSKLLNALRITSRELDDVIETLLAEEKIFASKVSDFGFVAAECYCARG